MVAVLDMPFAATRDGPGNNVKSVFTTVSKTTMENGDRNRESSAFPSSRSGSSTSSTSSHGSIDSSGSTEEVPTADANGIEEKQTDAESTSSEQSWRASLLDHLKSNLKVMILGQLLSLLLASAGAAQATLHLDCGLSAPTFTMTLVYFGLAAIHLRILIWRHRRPARLPAQPVDEEDDDRDVILPSTDDNENGVQMSRSGAALSSLTTNGTNDEAEGILCRAPTSQHSFFGYFPLHHPLWWYIMISFVDVEANAVTMLAYRYTTLTSVTVFDALAIPAAMAISRCWLGRNYRWMHYAGLAVCMLGVVLNVLQDYESDVAGKDAPEEELVYPNKFRGDLCAIAGGLMYGLNNVLTEVTVQDSGDAVEYLAMMGLCAFTISFIQSMVFEWDAILGFFGRDEAHSSTCSVAMGWTLFFSFAGVTMLNYAGASRFLMISEAAFFNLSLLTGDLWSVVFSIVAESIVPQPLFFVALVFVLSGVVVYEMAPSPADSGDHKEDYDGIQGAEYSDDIIPHVENPPSRLIRPGDDEEEDDADGIEMKESAVIS